MVPADQSLDWMNEAVCKGADVELFFPTGSGNASAAYAQAKREFCDRCPVQVECLEYALANGDDNGMWGGESERSRRRFRRTLTRVAS